MRVFCTEGPKPPQVVSTIGAQRSIAPIVLNNNKRFWLSDAIRAHVLACETGFMRSNTEGSVSAKAKRY